MSRRTLLHIPVLLTAVYLLSGTTADPDLWGHVRFGQDMIRAHSVHVPEHYSFVSDKPWVNHEWLAEVLMAAAFDWFGTAGLIVLRLALVGSLMYLLWSALPRSHRFSILIVSTTALGIFLRAYPIRPQLMSLLLFAGVCAALIRAEDRRSLKPLLVIPPVLAVWVNLHGGWIVGLGAFGLWAAVRMLDAPWRTRGAIVLIGIAGLAATLVNPFGLEMWAFLRDTVRVERPMIADWQPTYTLPPAFWGAWIAGFVITAIALRRGCPPGCWPMLAMTIGLGVMAVRVSRLDAFFAIAAAFLAARSFAQEPDTSSRADTSDTGTARPRPVIVRWGLRAGVAVVVLAIFVRASSIPAAQGVLPDAHVAHYIQDQRLAGKMLTWFGWGQYVIWHFGPGLQVSMDGRRETVYTDAAISAHLKFYFGERDEWRYADELGADYVLLPAHLPVVTRLKENGWTAVCEGQFAALLSKGSHVSRCGQRESSVPARRFPEL